MKIITIKVYNKTKKKLLELISKEEVIAKRQISLMQTGFYLGKFNLGRDNINERKH